MTSNDSVPQPMKVICHSVDNTSKPDCYFYLGMVIRYLSKEDGYVVSCFIDILILFNCHYFCLRAAILALRSLNESPELVVLSSFRVTGDASLTSFSFCV